MTNGSWARLGERARAQGGLFTVDDAVECGVHRPELRRRCDDSALVEVFREVFATSTLPVTPQTTERAVLLRAGPDAALAEESAAAFWGWVRRPAEVTVEVPAGQRLRPIPGAVVRRTRHPVHVRAADGRLVTPPDRTIVALGRIWTRHELGAAFLQALQREQTSQEAVATELRRLRGRPGVTLATSVLAEFTPEFESILSHEGIRLLESAGLRVRTGREVRDGTGRLRRPDALVVDHAGRAVLVVEFDGWAYHGTRERQQADRERDRALLAVGLPSVRLTTEDVRRRPAAALGSVRAALRAVA